MRQTAGTRSALTPTAQTQPAQRRTAAAAGGGARTTPGAGLKRPSLGDVPARDKPAPGARQGVGKGGWAGYNQARNQRTEKFPRFDVPEAPEYSFLYFPEDELFAFIYRHWYAKRPYTCIADPENEVECPMCDVAVLDPDTKAKPVVFYNVIELGTNTLKVWEMTAEPTRMLRKLYDKLAAIEKGLGDPGYYVRVSKEKKDNGFYDFTFDLVKARDLQEDYGVEPLTEDEIANATRRGLFTDEIVQPANRQDLREAANKISGSDD